MMGVQAGGFSFLISGLTLRFVRLFKYFNRHVDDLLATNQIKVTPPNAFDDPFEFCPQIDDMTESDLDSIRDATLKGEGKEEILRSLLSGGVREADLECVLKSPRFREGANAYLRARAKESARTTQARVSQDFGVLCFTENENDILMWSLYGGHHKGALIEFDSDVIERGCGWQLFKVCYRSERPRFNPAKIGDEGAFVLSNVRTKYELWKWQNEWRGLCNLEACRKVDNPKATIFLLTLPPTAITRVVLGAKMPESEKNNLHSINSGRGHPAKLQMARIGDRAYEVSYRDWGP